jgi:hypothetical protein
MRTLPKHPVIYEINTWVWLGELSRKYRKSVNLATVPYRNYWFWIDDRDMRSKVLFSFLMFIFSLTETGGKEGAPIITVPAG